MTAELQSPVRIGTLADESAMRDLLQFMYDENCIVSKNEDRLHDALRRGLTRQGAIIGVIGNHDQIEASIGLFTAQYWYSTDWHLEDWWCFVHPEFRQPTGQNGEKRPGYARLLLEFAKKCSTDLDIPLLIGVLSSHRTEAKVNLYRRHFQEAGAAFVYNTKYGAFANGSVATEAQRRRNRESAIVQGLRVIERAPTRNDARRLATALLKGQEIDHG